MDYDQERRNIGEESLGNFVDIVNFFYIKVK